MFPNNNLFQTYYSINRPGHICVYDRELKQIYLVIKCTPIVDLGTDLNDFKKLFKHLHNDFKLHADCTTNGPQATGGMWAIGWRPGYERSEEFNTYFYPEDGKKLDTWKALREEDYTIHTLYGECFYDMAPNFFKVRSPY